MLALNTKAPSFTLKNQNDENVSLADFSGKWLVLYFYPKALTPGCTTQACGLRDIQKELEALNATALGVSADSPEKLKKFTEKYHLNFTLVGDTSENKDMLKAYQAWGRKKFMGKEYDGIFRITYIVNPTGNIAHTIETVKTKSHHDDVLAWLKENA